MSTRLSLLVAILTSLLSPAAAFANGPAQTVAAMVAPKTALTPNGSWTTYHHDNAHTGYDPSAPTLTTVRPTPGWTNTTLDGEIYAESLIFNGSVFAATLNNTVYELDQATGLVVWSNHLGK